MKTQIIIFKWKIALCFAIKSRRTKMVSRMNAPKTYKKLHRLRNVRTDLDFLIADSRDRRNAPSHDSNECDVVFVYIETS